MLLTIPEPNNELGALIMTLSASQLAVQSVINRRLSLREMAEATRPLRIRYEIPRGKLVKLNPKLLK